MPKIPTFTTEATITGEVGSIKSNIQMSLDQTIGSALAPVTKEIVQHAVKKKDFENKTEALRLENDFIRDMQDVYTEAGNLENDDQAQAIVKNKSNMLIQKYNGLASNNNSRTLFNQYALSEVQKGIFRTSTAVERNTLIALDTLVSEKKSKLMITALDMKDGFDYEVLGRDLEDLYTINYKGKVSDAVLGKMISGIPNEIKFLEADKMISEYPREALEMLKDEKNFVGLNYDSRVKLIEKAKTILRPQIITEFDNYIKSRELGKEPPRFNFEFAKEVLSKPQAEKMMVAKTLADENADNVKLLHSVSNEDVLIQLEEMKKDNDNKFSLDLSIAANHFLEQSVTKILSDREENPFKYVLETDTDIENKLKELERIQSDGASFSAPNQLNDSLINQAQQEFTEIVLKKQKKLNIKNIKVMTNEASKQFVMDYEEAGNNSNKQKMSDMMASLITSYGNNEGLAIKQLRSDGLTFDALVSSVLGNSEIATIGLSFNTPTEKEEIKKYLKGEKIDFEEIKTEVNAGVKDFMSIALGNTPLDSTESLTKTNEIKEFLGFVAGQKLIGNPGMEQSEAVKYAVDTWMDNFVLADTYFINKQQGDKRFNDREIGNYIDKLDIVKKYYLDEMNIVAFKSSRETDPIKLSSKMYSQMLTNGEFRNTEDGEGQIFGIALDGSFAPVINDKGEQIILSINDKNNFVPGTNIPINYEVAFNDPEENTAESLINVYEEASELARKKSISYEEAVKEIRKLTIPNIKFE